MTECEPRSSGNESDNAANCATTTAQKNVVQLRALIGFTSNTMHFNQSENII